MSKKKKIYIYIIFIKISHLYLANNREKKSRLKGRIFLKPFLR